MPFINELKHTLPNVKAYRLMLQLMKEESKASDIVSKKGCPDKKSWLLPKHGGMITNFISNLQFKPLKT
jgi:hypothetical protein